MKILWWSNSPFTNSSYGIQTRQIIERLQPVGHEFAVASNFGLLGGTLDWRGTTIYPAWREPLGGDTIGYYARHFDADIVLSLYDIWALPADTRARLPCPWAALVPVDGAPVSGRMMKRIRTVDWPAAFSRFGLRELRSVGIEADYVPLGVDCGLFKPADKGTVRDQLGIPRDVFLVAMVAANKGLPPRKSWPEALAAFGRFRRRHPEARLYLHTTKTPFGSRGEGVYFDELVGALSLPPEAVTFVDEGELAVGIPDEQIAAIYQASDVLLNPAMGEGFCLPAAEAQACGTPVVTTDCSAMSENTVNGVAVAPAGPAWIPQIEYWWQAASIEGVDEALEAIYRLTDDERAAMAEVGVEFVRRFYDWPTVMERHWRPFLEKIERELW